MKTNLEENLKSALREVDETLRLASEERKEDLKNKEEEAQITKQNYLSLGSQVEAEKERIYIVLSNISKTVIGTLNKSNLLEVHENVYRVCTSFDYFDARRKSEFFPVKLFDYGHGGSVSRSETIDIGLIAEYDKKDQKSTLTPTLRQLVYNGGDTDTDARFKGFTWNLREIELVKTIENMGGHALFDFHSEDQKGIEVLEKFLSVMKSWDETKLAGHYSDLFAGIIKRAA